MIGDIPHILQSYVIYILHSFARCAEYPRVYPLGGDACNIYITCVCRITSDGAAYYIYYAALSEVIRHTHEATPIYIYHKLPSLSKDNFKIEGPILCNFLM